MSRTDSQLLTVADFDFHLPEELIAQQPPTQRGASRMLVLNCSEDEDSLTDGQFADLPSLLNPGDLLILNDSRVIPARLYARRANSRGKQEASGLIEVLLTSPDGAGNWNAPTWRALVRPGRKVRPGDQLEFLTSTGSIALQAEVIATGEFGERTLRFESTEDFFAILDQIGHMPLPPYIKRPQNVPDATADRERYQTVFAAQRGSVAAPTAGLHFTPSVLEAIAARGVEIARLTLHVGLGTFAPLRVERVDQIHLHSERYTLPPETAEALNRARAEGRRIVAVGTTAVRTLEHCALIAESTSNGQLQAHSGETSIFISPGFQFRLVGAMLTNFHLPKSSLLMLVSAFAGRERVLAAYAQAVREQYRFFSYGDCMFIK
ncbi:MAG TPA: tRNA preQ1(34) S-adenosylmethionine ribosyltransferase-isomerase QueA [Acidobacteriaceae bacterium]|jgi:S-adenosylmethionine:tRNA ribosyltransferase-isomerase|nr:tRNA preQ1(34) S-adenosylmethionine ribosyltransferase-isomerase QueA [Acidobacteriaceae bacterium]